MVECQVIVIDKTVGPSMDEVLTQEAGSRERMVHLALGTKIQLRNMEPGSRLEITQAHGLR